MDLKIVAEVICPGARPFLTTLRGLLCSNGLPFGVGIIGVWKGALFLIVGATFFDTLLNNSAINSTLQF